MSPGSMKVGHTWAEGIPVSGGVVCWQGLVHFGHPRFGGHTLKTLYTIWDAARVDEILPHLDRGIPCVGLVWFAKG